MGAPPRSVPRCATRCLRISVFNRAEVSWSIAWIVVFSPRSKPPTMRYELLVGLRYTRAKRRNRFIGINSLISIIGIWLGVWALIVVLSVMNGFQKEVRTRILGVVSHVQVTGPGGLLAEWRP